MGYLTRYTLRIAAPAHGEILPLDHSPEILVSTIERLLAEEYGGSIGLDRSTGTLCHGEATKWYDAKPTVTRVSAKVPSVIFILEGLGEEPGDHWVQYSFRGSSYSLKAEPWIPPPADLSKLPPNDPVVKIPTDPPTPTEALQRTLEAGIHDPTCSSLRGVSYRCTCYLNDVKMALHRRVYP